MNATASIEHALALHRSGDLAGAHEAYRHILEDHPDDAGALHLMGVICGQRQEWQEAESLFRRCIAIAPGYAAAHGNLGLILAESGRVAEAVAALEHAVVLDPAQPGVWNTLGMVLVRCGRYGDAVHACRTALAYAPDAPDACCNLANALRGTGDLAGALDAATRAVALRPAFAEALNSLGNILAELHRTQEAIDAYDRALAVRPGYISALNNLAKLHRELGNLERSRTLYQRSIALDPARAEAHWGLASVHLLAGEMAEGWKEYAWRWHLASAPDARTFTAPRWDGIVRPGLTLLVVCEQGLGDAVQFIRYAALLAAQGIRVLVETPEPLVRLFQTVAGIDTVLGRGSPMPAHDAYCPLLDLPQLCATTLASIPSQIPYVHAVEAGLWQTRLACDPAGVRIGLAWMGSPGHCDDRRRSCDALLMTRFADVPGVVLYNVQKGLDASAVPQTIQSTWRDHSAGFTDVASTAGLIANLDLVITVDTMVAHLAGALGVRVWLLLPHAPDWRWMLGREDSPWYPGMRLFRQRQPGDWQGVMDDVLNALSPFVAGKTKAKPVLPAVNTVADGLRLHEAGDLPAAAMCYREALRTAPDDPDALYLLSVVSHQTGRTDEGITCVRRLLDLHPDHPEGWNSFGNLLHDASRYEEAEHAFLEALRLRPGYGEAVYNRGRVLCDQWRLEEASTSFDHARVLGVPETLARTNAGLALFRQGRITEAIAEFLHAIALDGGCVDAHWNLAHALLQTGDLRRGWQEFEWRWARSQFRALKDRYPMPWWDGTPLPGRTILVWAEQGFGDVIHFLRYLPVVASRGLRIIVVCPAPLQRLVSAMDCVVQTVAPGDVTPQHDVQCALLSLPAVLGQLDDEFPVHPLLRADHAGRECWRERLAPCGSRLRVGVVWAGSRTNPAGRYRSIPVDQLAVLADLPGVVFIDLQKDDPDGLFARSALGEHGLDWTEALTDFAETAALIAELDVVITIDTAVAHIAGAIRKETWLLLSRHHDWRWGVGAASTPWYPSFRLLRQSRQGEWRDVVAQCRTMLEQRLSFEGALNTGVLHLHEGRPGDALRDLSRAVSLAPDHPGAHFTYALGLLGAGAWERGFAEYEWRLRLDSGHASVRPYPQPRWTGESLAGRTILVYAEQGFGDAIQFVRYAALLHGRGARVIVECRKELAALMRCASGVDDVIIRGDEPPSFDTHIPMLSIPGIVGTTPHTVPADVPYIHLPETLRRRVPEVLADAPDALKVGIVWSGNAISSVDGERSVSQEEMLRALPAADVTYVALQAGAMAATATPGMHILDASAAIHDFLDTAHIIYHLDMVVSVDTASAHLAGALGKPVVTLIPVHADWRWLTGSDVTAWYPSMRLLRQQRRGVWSDVLRRLAEDLQVKREHYDHQ